MASVTPTSPDTLVTLKVNVEGSNRRLKLPLRDLGAQTLPEKLRFLLAIPPTSEVIFERFSDSAAAFVTLDPNNASVYKQLYRAAKAKLKLRIKVTIRNPETEPMVPKRATVEDDVNEEQAPTTRTELPREPTVSEWEALRLPGGFDTARKAVPAPAVAPVPSCFQKLGAAASSSHDIPVTKGAALRDKWFADLAGLKLDRENAFCPRQAPSNTQVGPYSVYCNKCNNAIPDEHYHCGTCDDGDFDLCQSCIDKGVLCNGDGHWMIKRFLKNGKVITSVTEILEPRSHYNYSKTTLVEEAKEVPAELPIRTCNSCVQEFAESNFVTCTTCDDFDLCIACHSGLQHGHNPKHGFVPAVADMQLDPLAELLLEPGRNVSHYAICDGCDKYIYGVRHKCLDCPDWDYCNDCIQNVEYIHPTHRFVPIYEALNEVTGICAASRQKYSHTGIYCDGPLCNPSSSYIRGDRYKCAVCHDTDFCGNCEASPSNSHNKTHPLIKFKTPVRNVSVTTMGDHNNGQAMPVMGDRVSRTCPRSTETANAATQVRTVADLKPTEATKVEDVKAEEVKVDDLKIKELTIEETESVQPKIEDSAEKEAPAEVKAVVEEELVAHFVRDSVPDGSAMAPNTVFEQTWVLRNGGSKSWPAGCTVKFVGGDNMCANDPDHPASVHELVSAAESTTCYSEIAPGQETGFTVLLRTPSRPGKVISYWRLTGPTGLKFGHRLWCDVTVLEPEPEPTVEDEKTEEQERITEKSQMIFPKLDKESPESSVHQTTQVVQENSDLDEFQDVIDEDDFEDETEDGFLTDEEYDILDASDEEYLADQERSVKK